MLDDFGRLTHPHSNLVESLIALATELKFLKDVTDDPGDAPH